MNEQERLTRIQLLGDLLQQRSKQFPQCFVCGDPYIVHRQAKGTADLICCIPGCACKCYTLPRVPDLIEVACDELFSKIKRFKLDRSPEALHEVAKQSALIEQLFYEPVLINRGRALQVCNTRVAWGPSKPWKPTANWQWFPSDEPLFYLQARQS